MIFIIKFIDYLIQSIKYARRLDARKLIGYEETVQKQLLEEMKPHCRPSGKMTFEVWNFKPDNQMVSCLGSNSAYIRNVDYEFIERLKNNENE